MASEAGSAKPAKRGFVARLLRRRSARAAAAEEEEEEFDAADGDAGAPVPQDLGGEQDSDVDLEETELYPRRPLVCGAARGAFNALWRARAAALRARSNAAQRLT
jgi:hypothetical protein